MFGNKRFDVDDADNIIIDGVRYTQFLRINFQENSRRSPQKWSPEDDEQVQEHAAGDERAQIQVFGIHIVYGF